MTTYITQEQVKALYEKTVDAHFHYPDDSAEMHTFICNAAIQHYRDSLVAGVVLPEPFDDWPEYYTQAIGCGLEDQGITDRYEAAAYGWQECEQRTHEQGPFYTDAQLRQGVADALCVAEKETAELRLYKHNMGARLKNLNSMLADALAKQVPPGYKLVPVEPVEAQWGELARDIVFWLYMSGSPHHGSKLHDHLRNLGRDIPDWLTKEIPDVGHTPAKGTVAACIYRAMLEAAPDPKNK